MTDDVSDDELEKRMSKSLFAMGKPRSSISVQIRRRRSNSNPKVKTFVEVTRVEKSVATDEDTFDMTIVSASARTKIKAGLSHDELKAEVDLYREDGTNVEFVDRPWHKWVR